MPSIVTLNLEKRGRELDHLDVEEAAQTSTLNLKDRSEREESPRAILRREDGL